MQGQIILEEIIQGQIIRAPITHGLIMQQGPNPIKQGPKGPIIQGPMLKEDERAAYQAAFNTFDWFVQKLSNLNDLKLQHIAETKNFYIRKAEIKQWSGGP